MLYKQWLTSVGAHASVGANVKSARTRQSGNATAWSLLLVVTAALFVATLYVAFVVAPVELQMGIVQKIFYFHVPSAYLSLIHI